MKTLLLKIILTTDISRWCKANVSRSPGGIKEMTALDPDCSHPPLCCCVGCLGGALGPPLLACHVIARGEVNLQEPSAIERLLLRRLGME